MKDAVKAVVQTVAIGLHKTHKFVESKVVFVRIV